MQFNIQVKAFAGLLAGIAVMAAAAASATGLVIFDPPGQGQVPFAAASADGLSGITFVGSDQFFTVADSGALLYPTTIDIDLTSGLIVGSPTLNAAATLTGGTDLEGVAYDPLTDTVIVSDETGPAVRTHPAVGGAGTAVSIPAVYTNIRATRSLESLSRNRRTGELWTANEEALSVDGPVSNTAAGTVVRLSNLTSGQQWAYQTDPYRSAFLGQERSGVSDLVALPNGKVLVLERELSGDLVNGAFRNRIYQVGFAGADDVAAMPMLDGEPFTAVGKTLLWEGFFANTNFEGIALGPRLDSGDHALVLVADDDSPNTDGLYVLHLQGTIPEPSTGWLIVVGGILTLGRLAKRNA